MRKNIKYLFLIWIMVNIYTAIDIIYYPTSRSNQKADVAMVLGCTIKENKPSNIFARRLDHAIYLYKNSRVPKILITGGKGNKIRLSEAEAGKNYILQMGVPEKDILTETTSTTTLENFEFSKPILNYNKFKSVLLVSDPFHMTRAMKMAKDKGIIAYSSPTQTSSFKSTDSKLFFIMMEIPKLHAYVLGKLF